MFYFLLSLIINIILIYYIYKKIITRYSEPEKRLTSEINSLIIEFNKISKNNIDLIEDRIEEVKNLLKLMDKKKEELEKLKNDLENNRAYKNIDNTHRINITDNIISEINNKTSRSKKRPKKVIKNKKEDKYTLILNLYKKNKTIKEIAEILGISRGEVKLYIDLIKAKGE